MSIKLGLTFLVFVTVSVGAGATVDISSVTVSAIKTDSVVIDWDSTVAGTSQIEYGTTVSYGRITSEESLSYFHTTEISGLAEGTLYHFRIRSKEYGGAETVSADYTFATRTQAQLEAVIKTARIDKGLAKTYYVKTDGNDANDGLSIATAWQHPSYAVSKADVGDTIYLLDGTWSKEYSIFQRSGIDVAPITLTAYNGTPILDGVTKPNDNTFAITFNNGIKYITISNLKITRYSSCIGVSDGTSFSHINIFNNVCDDTANWNMKTGRGSHYIYFVNNTFTHAGWNTLELRGREDGGNNDQISTHIYIHNNVFVDSIGHTGGVDVVGEHENVEMTGNTFTNVSSALFIHGITGSVPGITWMNFSNNIITDSQRVHLYYLRDSLVNENTINGSTQEGFYGSGVKNLTLINNTVIGTVVGYPYRLSGTDTDILFIDSIGHKDTDYVFGGSGANVTLRFTKYLDTFPTFKLNAGANALATTEFINNLVFKITKTYGATVNNLSLPEWYPTKSNFSYSSPEANGVSYQVTAYPMIARPAAGSATVTVHKFDTALAKGNILVDFTADTDNGNNVDFVVGDLKADTNYGVKISSVTFHIVKANVNKCIKFSNSEWSAKNFTIEETGLAPDIITDPSVNIDSDTRPPIITPYAPQSLSATVGDGEVNLSWQSPASDGGSPITGYKVYRSNASGLETFLAQIGTSLSYTDATVNNGVTYYYQVSAVNSAGEGAKSNEVIALPTSSSVGSGNLETIKVYPNPYIRGKSSSEKITFSNLPKEVTIKIYNASGELIKELSELDGKAEWNVDDVSSGVYLYVVSYSEGVNKGKVSIIK